MKKPPGQKGQPLPMRIPLRQMGANICDGKTDLLFRPWTRTAGWLVCAATIFYQDVSLRRAYEAPLLWL